MWDMLRTASWILEFPIHGKFEHLKSVLFYQHVVPIMKNNCEPWQLPEPCTVGPDSAEARSAVSWSELSLLGIRGPILSQNCQINSSLEALLRSYGHGNP